MARLAPRLFVLLAASAVFLTQAAGAPTPASTASPAPTPTPAPTPATAPADTAVPTYSGAQQGQYIATAQEAFVALRHAKSQAFVDAYQAFLDAGGNSTKNLATKADITERRDLLAKCIAANDDYLNFVKTQKDTLQAELAKTPLTPADVETIVADFEKKANTDGTVKLREKQADLLKCSDDVLARLIKTYGAWTAGESGHIAFKRKADSSAYNALLQKYNALAADLQKMKTELTAASPAPSLAAPSPGGSPGASPSATVASPSPATPTPAAAK